jgi:hypothetical protein
VPAVCGAARRLRFPGERGQGWVVQKPKSDRADPAAMDFAQVGGVTLTVVPERATVPFHDDVIVVVVGRANVVV